MLSRPVAVLIAFVLFCSAFATYGQAGGAAQVAAAPAESFLAIGAAEPDAGDGPAQISQDDPSFSTQLEGGGDSPEGVAPLAQPALTTPAPARPRPLTAAAGPGPILDGLRRPPRAAR